MKDRTIAKSISVLMVLLAALAVMGELLLSGCSSGGNGSVTPPQQTMATPVIAPGTGNQVVCGVSVTITDATAGAVIHYTTDGTTPTGASAVYSKAFTASCPTAGNSLTVRAYAPAESASYLDSQVASATYTFAVPMAVPVISPATGAVVSESQSANLTDATPGAVMYYTTDGTTPTQSSQKYAGLISLWSPAGTAGITVKAYAPALGPSYVDSSVASATYTYIPAPTISVGTMSGPVLLNATNVVLPVTTTNCLSMSYTITPDFPVPPGGVYGGVLGSITFDPKNPCLPSFNPGSTMPGPAAQYVVTFIANGVQGTGSAHADLVINLTTPAITMDPTTPMSPNTAPAGNGDVQLVFNGSGCPFVSWNGAAYGSSDYWTGTMEGSGSVQSVIDSGYSAGFTDCNHVFTDISYYGAFAGGVIYEYLVNPSPGGGNAGPMTLTFVASSTTSAVATTANGTSAILKSQSTVNYLDPNGKIVKTEKSAPGVITFGSKSIPAGDIHQLIACGSTSENICGLGKTSLTLFNDNGLATHSYNLPEDAKFALANGNGTYVFSTSGHLYSLDATRGAFNLLNGFNYDSKLTTAALSDDGNEIAALTSDGHLQLYDVNNDKRIATYEVATEQNNIAFNRDGSLLFGKLGSAKLYVLDRSGTISSYELPATLLTLVQNEGSEALASLRNGDVIAVDSYGKTAPRAHAKPEDLYAGFRLAGRTLVIAPMGADGVRRVERLVVGGVRP